MMIGFITELLLWPEKFTLDLTLESDFFLTFMEENTESAADPLDINMLEPR